jgi:hypothetical protein
MDATALRSLQAPLEQEYRYSAAAARLPAHAEATVDADNLASTVRTWRGETVAGLHPAAGGDGSQTCSGDMLLEALVACAGVTPSAVATTSTGRPTLSAKYRRVRAEMSSTFSWKPYGVSSTTAVPPAARSSSARCGLIIVGAVSPEPKIARMPSTARPYDGTAADRHRGRVQAVRATLERAHLIG